MESRGISQLLTTVIIIGITVVLFSMSGSWFQTFSNELLKATSKESTQQLTCSSPNAKLDITSACYNKDSIIIVVEAGNLGFEKFLFSLVANELISVETDDGIEPYGIRRIEISNISADLIQTSKNTITSNGIDFKKSTKITAIPTIQINNENIICKNLILEQGLVCCKAGDACGCSTNDDCIDNAPKSVCNTVSGLCVECTDDAHCGSGKICQSNQCVAKPLVCGDITSSSYTVEESSESLCLRDTEIRLKVKSILGGIKEFKIDIKDTQGKTFTKILQVSGGELILTNARYSPGNIATNDEIKEVTVIPRVDVNGADCADAAITKSFLFEGNVMKCCERNIQCDKDGIPLIGNTCCERDCGRNQYINTEGSYLGATKNDLCVEPNIINFEFYCKDGAMTSSQMNCESGATCSPLDKECKLMN